MDFDDICDMFEERQKVMCRPLFAWVNEGSHFAHDDVFYTFDQASIDIYMEILKQIFVKTD